MLKNLLLLAGFSTFVVIVLVGLDVYLKSQESTLPKTTQQHLTPINPNFDKETLEKLKGRDQIIVNLEESSAVTSEDSQSTTRSSSPTPQITQEVSTSSGNFSEEGNTTQL